MLERVVGTIFRYNMLRPGHRVGIAVSGGIDSVCLLEILRQLAGRLGLSLVVLHLNHKLRAQESEEDAVFVRALAARLNLPFIAEEVDVRAVRGNLEQAGRNARYAFYSCVLARGAADRIATGHTRSDQAETVLYRIIRGSGTAGLAGIAPVIEPGIVRPLLECDRAEVESFAREHNLEWREDKSNQEHRFVRNRIRHCLLPALKQDNPAISGVLAGMASVARAEEDYWSAKIGRLFAKMARLSGNFVLFDTHSLASLDLAVQRRLIREAIRVAKGDLRSISFPHVEEVLSIVNVTDGDGAAALPGVTVQRSFNWLRFVAGVPQTSPYAFAVEPPARVAVPGGVAICLDLVEFSALDGANRYNKGCLIDFDRLYGPLMVRNWRPGDRYSPQGADSNKKIKQLFQRARIPSWERKSWPVVTSGDKIVWCKQFGASKEVIPGADTRTVLSIREAPGGD